MIDRATGISPQPYARAAGVVYLIGGYTLFLVRAYGNAVAPLYAVPVVSEVALWLWLFIKGVNVEAWRARMAAPVGA